MLNVMLNTYGNWVHFFQGEKDAALLKIAELKDALSESNTEVLSFCTSLTESENKIKELEATLFATQEQHSSDASFREQEVTKISQKIAALENDLEEHTKIKSSLENELKTTVSIVKLVHVTASFNNIQHLWTMMMIVIIMIIIMVMMMMMIMIMIIMIIIIIMRIFYSLVHLQFLHQ